MDSSLKRRIKNRLRSGPNEHQLLADMHLVTDKDENDDYFDTELADIHLVTDKDENDDYIGNWRKDNIPDFF